jgi:membrane protease YdiL (CAAX protease family)
MLFLLKRTVGGGLTGLVGLAALGLLVRHLRGEGAPPIFFTLFNIQLGALVCLGVLCSDGLVHGGLLLLFRRRYFRRYAELAAVFRGQSYPALLAGAAMAGVGEELVFRGLSASPLYLAAAGVAFGLLHHVRRSLWPFTLWAVLEGLLFATAVACTGALAVTMVAHFLHDVTGFLIFRHLNRRTTAAPAPGDRLP